MEHNDFIKTLTHEALLQHARDQNHFESAMSREIDAKNIELSNLRADLAEARAALEAAPTATLRQQLAGSQSALSKVMGELTEAREQLERRRIDYAKVQADLYNQIEAEKAQTAEAYRQRDVARADLAEARAALDRATESKPFRQHDELQQLRTSNHYMTEELTRLREERNAEAKDLAEARADVQRFEAALDVSQRELARARADVAALARSYLKPYARALKQDPDDGEYSATIIEFAGCYSEGETRDEALANIEEAATGWMLAALSMGRTIPEPMKYRRTIRALVVFGRAAWRSLRTLAGNQARWQMAQLGVKVNMLLISERSKTTHD